MREYGRDLGWEIVRWEENYEKLSVEDQTLLSHLPGKFEAAKDAVENNESFFLDLLSAFDPEATEGVPDHFRRGAECANGLTGEKCRPQDAEKVRYVLKDLVRNWSEEGAAEREQSFGRVLARIRNIFPEALERLREGHAPPRVLVPGAGLGRLCLELASLGLQVQGNEWSYYMLLTSSFILNHSEKAGQWNIHPWVQFSSNVRRDADQLRPCAIPDVVPSSLIPSPGLMSMCAGDFVEVYSRPDQHAQWDCIVTCFFLDTAHNPIEYLNVIHRCLRPGGRWVNLGPLLYHWADSHTYLSTQELSVELSLEDIERLALGIGFAYEGALEMVEATYTSNCRSMMRTVFDCGFFTMVKKQDGAGAGGLGWAAGGAGAAGAGAKTGVEAEAEPLKAGRGGARSAGGPEKGRPGTPSAPAP